MKRNISKELFEAIYNCNLSTDKDMKAFYIRLVSDDFAGYVSGFFFKCKEWAFSQGYVLDSNSTKDGNAILRAGKHSHYITAHDEQQAVFDACQYLLKKKRQK